MRMNLKCNRCYENGSFLKHFLKVLAAALFFIPVLFPLGTLAATTPPEEGRSLRQRIPLNAAGYLRIPNAWSLFSVPKDSMMKEALDNYQVQEQVSRIRASMEKGFQQGWRFGSGAWISIFLARLRSPIEAVFLLPEGSSSPAVPNVLISAGMDFSSTDEIENFLQDLVAEIPSLAILKKFAGEPYAVLMMAGSPLFLNFNPQEQRMYLMGGQMINEQIFQDTLSSLRPIERHPMFNMEKKVDTSGHGFFLWINMQRLLPAIDSILSAKQREDFHKWGLTLTRAVSLGWGTREGKARLKLLVDAPRAGYRQLLPDFSHQMALTASGAPKMMLALSAPGLDLLKWFEAILQQEAPADLVEIQAAKEKFLEKTGISLEELLGAFGPETVLFSDEIGVFLALRARDSHALKEILKVLVEKHHLAYEVRYVEKKAYNHLVIPRVLSGRASPSALLAAGVLPGLPGGVNIHLYWIEEEGYLIFAPLPQMLMDRQRHRSRVSIQDWLLYTQRQDVRSSIFSFSTTISDTPQHLYYAYLRTLDFLADLAAVKIDLFSLPSFMDLKLPHEGAYGIQLDISDPFSSLEFTFENNPVELLLSRGIDRVAFLGVMAAIAIPNFVKYRERSRMMQ